MSYQIAKRLFSLAVTMLLVMAAVFFVLQVLPGDPALVMLGPDAQPDTIAALHRELGLDHSAIEQFGSWLGEMSRGDFGVSYAYHVPVVGLIVDRLAITVPLAIIATVLVIVLSVTLGVYAATNHGNARGHAVMVFAQVGIALPSFWFALLLILVFSIRLSWFPAGGFPGWSAGFWPAIQALLLPSIALALVQAAILTRVTRAALLEVLHEDFIRTARATGLSRRQVLWKHALQNALIPVATVMGLQFAALVAGTIIIENVFSLPGLGRLLFLAVEQRDLIVIRSVVVLLVGVVVLTNYLVDIAYVFIDPRMRKAR